MADVNVHCPQCHSTHVYRHGYNPNNRDRFRCCDCLRVFQLTYIYEARKPGVKEKIMEMYLSGAGIRKTARVLNVSTNTVIRTLKKENALA